MIRCLFVLNNDFQLKLQSESLDSVSSLTHEIALSRAMPQINNKNKPRTGAYLNLFKQKYGLTVSKMCALFGISTQAKFNSIVRPPEGNSSDELLDPTVALILRLYETHESLVPLNNELSLEDTYKMFQRVFGKTKVTESTFGQLLGRSAGSGYRWLNGSGNATPQVGIVLERLRHMLASGMEEPEVCYLWLDIVHQEYRARNQVPPLSDIDAVKLLIQKYPLKYKHMAS